MFLLVAEMEGNPACYRILSDEQETAYFMKPGNRK